MAAVHDGEDTDVSLALVSPDHSKKKSIGSLDLQTSPQALSQPQVVVVQLLRHVQLFATLWTAGCQASLSFTISKSSFKLMFI